MTDEEEKKPSSSSGGSNQNQPSQVERDQPSTSSQPSVGRARVGPAPRHVAFAPEEPRAPTPSPSVFDCICSRQQENTNQQESETAGHELDEFPEHVHVAQPGAQQAPPQQPQEVANTPQESASEPVEPQNVPQEPENVPQEPASVPQDPPHPIFVRRNRREADDIPGPSNRVDQQDESGPSDPPRTEESHLPPSVKELGEDQLDIRDEGEGASLGETEEQASELKTRRKSFQRQEKVVISSAESGKERRPEQENGGHKEEEERREETEEGSGERKDETEEKKEEETEQKAEEENGNDKKDEPENKKPLKGILKNSHAYYSCDTTKAPEHSKWIQDVNSQLNECYDFTQLGQQNSGALTQDEPTQVIGSFNNSQDVQTLQSLLGRNFGQLNNLFKKLNFEPLIGSEESSEDDCKEGGSFEPVFVQCSEDDDQQCQDSSHPSEMIDIPLQNEELVDDDENWFINDDPLAWL